MTFPCSSCGACCRVAFMVPEHLREGVIVPDETGKCVHLKPDNSCDIYETRPKVCRVDKMRPKYTPVKKWHRANLMACDQLHLAVYGSPRIPLET